MAAMDTHTYPKYCGCGMIGRNPKKMHVKKLIMMHLSLVFNSFFPFKVKVRNTSVGALLSHSPHNTAGVPTLEKYKGRKIKRKHTYTYTVGQVQHVPKNIDAKSIPFEEN